MWENCRNLQSKVAWEVSGEQDKPDHVLVGHLRWQDRPFRQAQFEEETEEVSGKLTIPHGRRRWANSAAPSQRSVDILILEQFFLVLPMDVNSLVLMVSLTVSVHQLYNQPINQSTILECIYNDRSPGESSQKKFSSQRFLFFVFFCLLLTLRFLPTLKSGAFLLLGKG